MKTVIIGGGGSVGSCIAFNLLLRNRSHDVVLVDARFNMIASHVMDLEHTLPLGAGRSIRAGTEEEVLDADILAVCASVPLRVNSSRFEFLQENAVVLASALKILKSKGSDWQGVILMVTNPVDPLCTWVQRCTGIPRSRIIGYSLNDSLRFRSVISQVLSVEPRMVEAWVLGEHGDYCVPLFGRIRVLGSAVILTTEQQQVARQSLRSWYVRHVALDSGRTSSWTTGLGVSRMIDGMANPTGEVWPASVVLEGEYGIEGVSQCVPVSVSRLGVVKIHEWTITPNEDIELRHSAVQTLEATRMIQSTF